MKILVYCQHVLGIGHLSRTMEIIRHLQDHRVMLVLGGPPVDLELPDKVEILRLPGLRMDAEFSGLLPVEPEHSLPEVKEKRKTMLRQAAERFQPDVILIELFPFGRNGFSFELVPLLESVRAGTLPTASVLCSLRDILVEKKDQEKYEKRVIERLNRLFDGLLIHGDPEVIPLDATFVRMKEITVPVIYTGYISEQKGNGGHLKEEIHLRPDEKLIVVSAGGGHVGHPLLHAAIQAFKLLEFPVRMQVFTGPYLSEKYFTQLKKKTIPGVGIARFTADFPDWLAAADLSISMGGYNTTMNILAAGIPALILPFIQNREQRLRTARMAELANIRMLDERKLSPSDLATDIGAMIRREKMVPPVRLDGAEQTRQWLRRFAAGERQP